MLQERTRELNLHQYNSTALRVFNANVYEMKWR
jgi:hypothetical protein